MTNRQKLNSMSDEEIAEIADRLERNSEELCVMDVLPHKNPYRCCDSCYDCVKKWLQQEDDE